MYSSLSSVLQESLNQNFLLVISHREAQRDYNLNFPGSRTIQEVGLPLSTHNVLSVLDGPQDMAFYQ